MKYTKQNGRFKFQIDLALELIEEGLKKDWSAPFENAKKPKWMRKGKCVPCNCDMCFFCKHDITTGIQHRPLGSNRLTPRTICRPCSLVPQHLDPKKKSNSGKYCWSCMRKLLIIFCRDAKFNILVIVVQKIASTETEEFFNIYYIYHWIIRHCDYRSYFFCSSH